MEEFKTVEELIAYSHERLSIRYNGMQRIHRSNIGLLKNTLLKHSPESNFKGTKCNVTYLKCLREFNFRITIKKLQLPISTKIM